jgi:cytochrome c oxidase subunit 4
MANTTLDPSHADGAVHVHVTSTAFYVLVFTALIGLTVLTVGQSYVDLGKLNLLAVILIATTKAALVVTFFMHLRHDNRFNALIFVACLFFIGVFFVYTLNDTNERGALDPDQNVKILPRSGETAPGGVPSDEE